MSSVVIYERALNRLLYSRTGTVGRIIDQKADAIFKNAELNIQETFESRTGDLEGGLRKIPKESRTGYHVVVGSGATHRGFPYARALETGINPLTGAAMNFKEDKAFMVPAVKRAGFRLRKA
jgi:hypothetical protein